MTTPAAASPRAGRREWVGLGVLALACLLYVMDLTVLHLAVPAISADLRPSSTQLLWIIDIYGFFVAGSLITMGTLGDRIGRRKLLLAGAAAFGAFSLLAAFSTSAEMLILSRALLGIAGATLAPSTLSLIFHMFEDPRERSVAIGVWIGSFSAGSAIGPVLGGLALQFFWWGSVFLLALPVMAALLILGPRVLPEYRDPNAGRLDLPSAAMAVSGVLAVIYGLKQTAQDGVGLIPILAILAGLAVGILFVRRQRNLADPMIDVRLFKIPAFNTALATNFLAIFVAVGYFLFIAQYLQLVAALSPLEAGLWSLPSAFGFIIGSQAAPRIVRLVRPPHVIGGGLAASAVGLAILTQVGASGELAPVVISSVIISLGLAPVFGLTTELIVGSAPPERAGAASGISETGSELGGALGIAVLGSVGVAIYRGQLATRLPASVPADVVAIARDTLGSAVAVARELPPPLDAVVLSTAREAFVDGMRLGSGIAAVVAVALAILALVTLRTHGALHADARRRMRLRRNGSLWQRRPTERTRGRPYSSRSGGTLGDVSARLRQLSTPELTTPEIQAIREMLLAAFGPNDADRFTEDDWQHAIGGVHFVLDLDGELAAHASVVPRVLHVGGTPLRTGYVEAVATAPSRQRTGFGTRVMRAVGTHIWERHELGALGTGSHRFYERLGWLTWTGPSSVRAPDGERRTPDEDGYIMVLPTRSSPPLDITAPISCDWRPGDVW